MNDLTIFLHVGGLAEVLALAEKASAFVATIWERRAVEELARRWAAFRL